VIRKNLLLQSQ